MEGLVTTYMIKRAYTVTPELQNFLTIEVPKISERFGHKFDYNNLDLNRMVSNGIFLYCERNGEVTGILSAMVGTTLFDVKLKILQQRIFYVKPDSGRTAYHLFKKFIDIGKREANHIITMLTSETNIKPQTLEKMGFKKMETLYRLEV